MIGFVCALLVKDLTTLIPHSSAQLSALLPCTVLYFLMSLLWWRAKSDRGEFTFFSYPHILSLISYGLFLIILRAKCFWLLSFSFIRFNVSCYIFTT